MLIAKRLRRASARERAHHLRRFPPFMFLNKADLVKDAVKKYYREYYPSRVLERACNAWLPDQGSNLGPAD